MNQGLRSAFIIVSILTIMNFIDLKIAKNTSCGLMAAALHNLSTVSARGASRRYGGICRQKTFLVFPTQRRGDI